MSFQSAIPTPSLNASGAPRGFDFLKDVDVRLSVELGRTDMKLCEVLSLAQDSVVILDRLTDELLDVMVNGKVIAKGEIIAQQGRFGLRIVEMAGSPAATPDLGDGIA